MENTRICVCTKPQLLLPPDRQRPTVTGRTPSRCVQLNEANAVLRDAHFVLMRNPLSNCQGVIAVGVLASMWIQSVYLAYPDNVISN